MEMLDGILVSFALCVAVFFFGWVMRSRVDRAANTPPPDIECCDDAPTVRELQDMFDV